MLGLHRRIATLGLVALVALLAACEGAIGERQSQGPAPSDLTSRVLENGSVHLAWNLGAGEHDNVIVYRAVGPAGEGELLARLEAGSTQFVDTDTAVGATYTYTVGVARADADVALGAGRSTVEPLPAVSSQPYVWGSEWTTSAVQEVQRGGTLTTSSRAPASFNPLNTGVDNALRNILADAQLAVLDEDGLWSPYAATGWQIQEDGDGGTITVQVRPGLRWSDGAPITAADYEFHYTLQADDPQASSWRGVSLRATGPTTLEYAFDDLYRTALTHLNLSPFPLHVFGEVYEAGGAAAVRSAWGSSADLTSILTAGPWKLARLEGSVYHLERNPYYGAWNLDGAGNRLPYVDSLRVQTSGAPIDAFLAGDLDFLTLTDVEAARLADSSGDHVLLSSVSQTGSSQFFSFNMNLASNPFLEELFRDVRFRRAISHLVDRQAYIDDFYGGAASKMWSSVYLTQPEWLDDSVPKYDYDPGEAQRILTEDLGFSRNSEGLLEDAEGRELRFKVLTNDSTPARVFVVKQLAAAALEAGILIEPEYRDINEIATLITSQGRDRDFQMLMLGVTGGSRDWPFPGTFDSCLAGTPIWNASGDCLFEWETEMARLISAGSRTLDDSEAQAIASRIQHIQAEEQPVIYLASPSFSQAWREHVRGEHPRELMAAGYGQRKLALTWLGATDAK